MGWDRTGKNNAYLCKRKTAGGVQFSRDPMNLVNKHSRKYDGFVNEKAIGINADSNTVCTHQSPPKSKPPNKVMYQVEMRTKLSSRANKPAAAYQTTSFSASTPSRKMFKSVVNATAKKGYRSDLRAEAVARASAVKKSQGEKKGMPGAKLRGAKARKAREEAAGSA